MNTYASGILFEWRIQNIDPTGLLCFDSFLAIDGGGNDNVILSMGPEEISVS